MITLRQTNYRILVASVLAAAACLLIAAAPGRADKQNLLSPITDDSTWHLAVEGTSAATVYHDDDILVCTVTKADGRDADVAIGHTGSALTAGHTYVLTFEARSQGELPLKVVAQTAQKPPRNAGLDDTVYLTPHWTPYSVVFTATATTSKTTPLPNFLLGRNVGTIYLRNTMLLPLVGPPPVDAGLPAPATPTGREVGYGGSIQSLLPNSKGFVMWATSKNQPGKPVQIIEPPHLIKILSANSRILLGAVPQAKNSVALGDLVSVAGTTDTASAALKAREIHLSRRYEVAKSTYQPPVPMAMTPERRKLLIEHRRAAIKLKRAAERAARSAKKTAPPTANTAP